MKSPVEEATPHGQPWSSEHNNIMRSSPTVSSMNIPRRATRPLYEVIIAGYVCAPSPSFPPTRTGKRVSLGEPGFPRSSPQPFCEARNGQVLCVVCCVATELNVVSDMVPSAVKDFLRWVLIPRPWRPIALDKPQGWIGSVSRSAESQRCDGERSA